MFLSIDDTMAEKKGEKFELCSRFFNHAAHNGSNYLNGHCMVSILLSFLVLADNSIRYLSVPLCYRLWDKKQTKLEIVTEMVHHALGNIDPDRQVFLLCNSWYPKGYIAGLVNEYQNLDIICNVRIASVIFELETPKIGDWKIGVHPTLIKLWGERIVYALVTLPKNGNDNRRKDLLNTH